MMREDFWVGGDVFIRWWVIDGQPGQYMTTMVDRDHLYNNQQCFECQGTVYWRLLFDLSADKLLPFEG